MRHAFPGLRPRDAPELWLTAALLGASAALFALLAATGWPGATHSCVASASCYCEAAGPGPIRQPTNTWSGLGWALAGLWIAWDAARRRRRAGQPANRMTSTRFYPGHYALVVAFLAPGAMFYHASLTEWGGKLDIVSMYLFINYWILYNVTRLYDLSRRTFLGVYAAATALLLIPRVAFGSIDAGIAIFAGLIGVAVLSEIAIALPARVRWLGPRQRLDVRRGWLWVSIALFLVARAAEDHLPCDPAAWFQRHAVLHLVQAVSNCATWLYFAAGELRSEPHLPTPPGPPPAPSASPGSGSRSCRK